MQNSTSINRDKTATASTLFSRLLYLKNKIRVCNAREKEMLRTRRGINYDKRVAKAKQEEAESVILSLKNRLKADIGKKRFKRTLISIFRKDSELFKRFLIDNYDFDGWKDTYDSIVYKKAMKDSDVNLIVNTNMHVKYIEYVMSA